MGRGFFLRPLPFVCCRHQVCYSHQVTNQRGKPTAWRARGCAPLPSLKRSLTTSLALSASAASAGVFTITGQLLDNTPTQIGAFEILIDEADLTQTITSGDVSFPLQIEPWYGYDVLSASVSLDGYSWTEASASAQEPPIGPGPEAEFWIEGVPIDQLTTEDFMVVFDDSTALLLLGFGTGSDSQRIDNELHWFTPNGNCSGNANTVFGGGYQNVNVALVPEPNALALLALGGLVLLATPRTLLRRMSK